MIELTRLNGSSIFVNYDQIKWAEAAPDTMLTLMNGEKVVVRESCSEVVQRMTHRRSQLLRQAAAATRDCSMGDSTAEAEPGSKQTGSD